MSSANPGEIMRNRNKPIGSVLHILGKEEGRGWIFHLEHLQLIYSFEKCLLISKLLVVSPCTLLGMEEESLDSCSQELHGILGKTDYKADYHSATC
jgi:hypothetical protein